MQISKKRKAKKERKLSNIPKTHKNSFRKSQTHASKFLQNILQESAAPQTSVKQIYPFWSGA